MANCKSVSSVVSFSLLRHDFVLPLGIFNLWRWKKVEKTKILIFNIWKRILQLKCHIKTIKLWIIVYTISNGIKFLPVLEKLLKKITISNKVWLPLSRNICYICIHILYTNTHNYYGTKVIYFQYNGGRDKFLSLVSNDKMFKRK